MNTIDYIADGQKVQFSNKAVSIDGESFAYIGISAIKHSASKRIYLFKYDDKWHRLSYNEADEQKLKTLFSRIAELNAKRAADASVKEKAHSAGEAHVGPQKFDVKSIMEHADSGAPEVTDVETDSGIESFISDAKEAMDEALFEEDEVEEKAKAVESAVAEAVAEAEAEAVVETEVEIEPEAEVETETEVEAEPETETETEVETEPVVEVEAEPETEAETEVEPTPEVEAETESVAEAEPEAETVVESASETEAEETKKEAASKEKTKVVSEILPPEERKAKLKKAFIIFAAVIALFVVLAIAYFAIAGTSGNPSVGPNSDETQQYDDIDDLIQDLQE